MMLLFLLAYFSYDGYACEYDRAMGVADGRVKKGFPMKNVRVHTLKAMLIVQERLSKSSSLRLAKGSLFALTVSNLFCI